MKEEKKRRNSKKEAHSSKDLQDRFAIEYLIYLGNTANKLTEVIKRKVIYIETKRSEMK